jgi:excisionase family DNA binding protein
MMQPRNRRREPPIDEEPVRHFEPHMSLAAAPPALTVRQVAAILQLSVDTVRDLIYQKKLPALNMGTKRKAAWRVIRDRLIELLDRRD